MFSLTLITRSTLLQVHNIYLRMIISERTNHEVCFVSCDPLIVFSISNRTVVITVCKQNLQGSGSIINIALIKCLFVHSCVIVLRLFLGEDFMIT